ncbi:MAG: hypothetical protein OEY89_02435 [Gammaproteobacteria bacterium]|nr:hypothetical protein [Gammaproteobacteria bacterium]
MASYYDEMGFMRHAAEMEVIVARQEFNLVAFLQPKIFIEGNMWCILYGENLQSGVAGFGDSPLDAVMDFNRAWHSKLSKRTEK